MMARGTAEMMPHRGMRMATRSGRINTTDENRSRQQKESNADYVFHSPHYNKYRNILSTRQNETESEAPAVKFQLSVQCSVASYERARSRRDESKR